LPLFYLLSIIVLTTSIIYQGNFVDAFGKDRTAEDVVARVEEAIKDRADGKKNFIPL